jgi:AsmA protein
MDTVMLDGMILNLAKNKSGVSNWDDLLKGEKKAPAEEKQPDESKGGLESLKIGGIHIKDAQLSWKDEQAGVSYALANLQLESGAISADKAVDVSLGFDLQDNKAGKSWHFGLDSLVKMDMQKETASFDKLVIALANIRLKGNMQIKQMMSAPAYSASLKSSEFVPREAFAEFGIDMPKTSDATVFGKAMLELALQGTASSIDVSKLLVRLDETSLSGKVGVSNFSKPAIRFVMDVDQIDVDRYLPPVQEQQETSKQAATDDSIVLPVEMLRGLNVNGRFGIAKMKAANLRSEAINMTLTANGGLIRIHPSTAKMYKGTYSGDVSLDVRGKDLVVSMNEKLSDIQAAPLFKDLADMEWIDGTGDLTAQLTGRGNTITAIRSSLGGNIGISFLDGKIKGVNIPYKIRQAYNLVKGLPAPAAEPDETPFTSITANATVKDGVVDNRDMKMDTPLLVVNGEGQVDLGKESMNYLVKATVNDKLADTAGEAMTKLKGRTVPVRIQGPFTKLKYKVEMDEVLKEQVKKKVEDKVKKKLDEKLGDKLKDKFKGLF